MVKARKNRQPRDYSQMTGMRSATGQISGQAFFSNRKQDAEKTFEETRKKDHFGNWKTTSRKQLIQPEKLSIESQINALYKKKRRMDKDLKNKIEAQAKHQNDETGAKLRESIQKNEKIYYETLRRIEELENQVEKQGENKAHLGLRKYGDWVDGLEIKNPKLEQESQKEKEVREAKEERKRYLDEKAKERGDYVPMPVVAPRPVFPKQKIDTVGGKRRVITVVPKEGKGGEGPQVKVKNPNPGPDVASSFRPYKPETKE